MNTMHLLFQLFYIFIFIGLLYAMYRTGKRISSIGRNNTDVRGICIRVLSKHRFILLKSVAYFLMYALRKELRLTNLSDYQEAYDEIRQKHLDNP